MIDGASIKIWIYRAGFVLLALLLTFGELLPLNTKPITWVMPDVLLCLTFACCVRRPKYVPMIFIAAVFLFQDLLLNRPPGLFAALVLMAAEWLKRRSLRSEEFSFLREYLSVLLALIVIFSCFRWAHGLALLPLPQPYLTFSELLSTALFYPVIVLLAQAVLKIRRPGIGDIEATAREQT